MEKTFHPAAADLYEYLLIVSPGKEVFEQVMNEKIHFGKKYQFPSAGKALPHITISNFGARFEMEETLIRWMQRIVAEQNSFPVTINNYGGFPSHTIFLSIADKTPFTELTTRLKTIVPYIKENTSISPFLSSSPHISIARKVPPDIYNEAMKDYAAKSFNASFEVQRLELLRRKNQYVRYEKVAQFCFKPIN